MKKFRNKNFDEIREKVRKISKDIDSLSVVVSKLAYWLEVSPDISPDELRINLTNTYEEIRQSHELMTIIFEEVD